MGQVNLRIQAFKIPNLRLLSVAVVDRCLKVDPLHSYLARVRSS